MLAVVLLFLPCGVDTKPAREGAFVFNILWNMIKWLHAFCNYQENSGVSTVLKIPNLILFQLIFIYRISVYLCFR